MKRKIIFTEIPKDVIQIKDLKDIGYFGGRWPDRDVRVIVIKHGEEYILQKPEFITSTIRNEIDVPTFSSVKECVEYYHNSHGLDFYKFDNVGELLYWALEARGY